MLAQAKEKDPRSRMYKGTASKEIGTLWVCFLTKSYSYGFALGY